jgi:hypothetical protein
MLTNIPVKFHDLGQILFELHATQRENGRTDILSELTLWGFFFHFLCCGGPKNVVLPIVLLVTQVSLCLYERADVQGHP